MGSKKFIDAKKKDPEAGSQEFPFRVGIIGGGPAGTSVLVKAVRLGAIDELCSSSCTSDKNKCLAGVCVFEGGKRDRLGGGRLQDYEINSNTYASKFISPVMDPCHVCIPTESIEKTCLSSLLNGGETRNGEGLQNLKKIGNQVVALKTVGTYLREVASCVQHCVSKYPTSRYEFDHMVESIQQVERLPRDNSSVDHKNMCDKADTTDNYLWKVKVKDCEIPCYCKNVVLATGGKQVLPDLKSEKLNNKLLGSDFICTEEGMKVLRKKFFADPRAHDKKRIVIVGGSHSAFSAAWMCLNKLVPYEGVADNSNKYRLDLQSVNIIHRSPIRIFYNCKKDAENAGEILDPSNINSLSGTVNTWGGLRGDAKNLYHQIIKGNENRIRLVLQPGQTMTQRLFTEATVIIWACGYSTNTIPIYGLTGAKLQLSDSSGLLNISSDCKLQFLSTMADVGSQSISSKKKVSNASNDDNKSSNIYSLPGIYGIGVGYSFKGEVEKGRAFRVDGVSIYLKRSALTILSHILGPRIMGSINGNAPYFKNFSERVEGIMKQKNEKSKLDVDRNSQNSEVVTRPATTTSPKNRRKVSIPASSLNLSKNKDVSGTLAINNVVVAPGKKSTTCVRGSIRKDVSFASPFKLLNKSQAFSSSPKRTKNITGAETSISTSDLLKLPLLKAV